MTNYHSGMPLLQSGAPLNKATAAMIMLHGRGAGADDILGLSYELDAPGMAFLAPQAANATWYPYRFVEPIARNEPWLSSALATIESVLQLALDAGIAPERVILLGFSQGGCLALEYAARNVRRYGAVVGFSASLIENGDQPRVYAGDFAQTPVLLGCSDVDFHIPLARVERTAEIFMNLGAQVDRRIYPNMGHTINRDELHALQTWVTNLA